MRQPLAARLLYVQVVTDAGRTAMMRTAPRHGLVEAPLKTTPWGTGQSPPEDTSTLGVAEPKKLKTRCYNMYQYNFADSNLIWTYASPYQDLAKT